MLLVDTAPIIYFPGDHRAFAARYSRVFERAAEGDLEIVISTIAVAEVLSGPAAARNEVLLETYRAALKQASGWRVVDVTQAVAVSAARSRARYRPKLPDAIQLLLPLVSVLRADNARSGPQGRRGRWDHDMMPQPCPADRLAAAG